MKGLKNILMGEECEVDAKMTDNDSDDGDGG